MSHCEKWHQWVVAVLMLCPGLSLANAPEAIEQMQKDEWLKTVKIIIPKPVCRGFMDDSMILARLNQQKLSYDQCLTIIPKITDQCTEKFYQELPEWLNQVSADKWGEMYGRCIGRKFAKMYLSP